MKINISFTEKGYAVKPEAPQISHFIFHNNDYELSEIKKLIMEGHSFCHNFGQDVFHIKHKENKNFVSAQFISIDIDAEDAMPLAELMMLYPEDSYPTFTYETFHSTPDAPRYRLVYCLDEPVYTNKAFKALYKHFIDIYIQTSGSNKIDHCARSFAQYMNGTDSSKMMLGYNTIYCVKDILGDRYEELNTPDKSGHSISIIDNTQHHYNNRKSTFENDYYNMKLRDFLDKYYEQYPFFDHTPLPETSSDIPYIILPDNYITVKRYWYVDKCETDEGLKYEKNRVRKIKNGQGRRKKLFINGILRRLMFPDIDFEYMLYCLCYEFEHFMFNCEDDIISKDDIFKLTDRVMRTDIENYEGIVEKDKRTFVLNPNYDNKDFLSKQQLVNLSKKMITSNKIGELYDYTLTDVKNIEVFKEYGLNINVKTLRRWKKDNNVVKHTKSGHSISIIEENNNHYNNRKSTFKKEPVIINNNITIIEKMENNNEKERILNEIAKWNEIATFDELCDRWAKVKKDYYQYNSNDWQLNQIIESEKVVQMSRLSA